MKRTLVLVALAVVASACATAQPGRPLPGSPGGAFRDLADAASFDHGCPKERIRFIREGSGAVDLDVCGDVRRYKGVGGFDPADPGSVTWLDVTGAYPRNVLPQPLAPPAGQSR